MNTRNTQEQALRSHLDISEPLHKAEKILEPFIKKSVFRADDKLEPDFTVNITRKLLYLFDDKKQFLPLAKKINIASFGCRVPHEYLAIRALYDEIDSSIEINFVGIEIEQEFVDVAKMQFANFSEVSIIQCDATNIDELRARLKAKNICPEAGFDFILLRNPDVMLFATTPIPKSIAEFEHLLSGEAALENPNPFKKMIQSSIPFFAKSNATVFLSTYNAEEFQVLQGLMEAKKYDISPHIVGVRLTVESNVRLFDKSYDADVYSVFTTCYGMGMKLEQAASVQFNPTASLANVSMFPKSTPEKRGHKELMSALKATGALPSAFLTAIDEKDYAKGLKVACRLGRKNLVLVLCDFIKDLNIDVNKPSTTGEGALDWLAKATNLSDDDRKAMEDRLQSEGAKYLLSLSKKLT